MLSPYTPPSPPSSWFSSSSHGSISFRPRPKVASWEVFVPGPIIQKFLRSSPTIWWNLIYRIKQNGCVLSLPWITSSRTFWSSFCINYEWPVQPKPKYFWLRYATDLVTHFRCVNYCYFNYWFGIELHGENSRRLFLMVRAWMLELTERVKKKSIKAAQNLLLPTNKRVL